jgi:hypothetical protein
VILAVGGVVLCVTVVVAVAVQPFEPVTVTVYVPGEVIVAVALVPKLFDHWYVPPPLAVLVTLVVVQLKLSEPVILAVGRLPSCVTEVVAVAVQPFEPVTVTVYVPGEVIVAVALVPKPFDHWYVPPPLAVLVTLVVVQLKLSEPVILAVGGVVLCVTIVVAVAVQPFEPVTVTVYVPGEVIVAVALVPKPFDQRYVPPPLAVLVTLVVVQLKLSEPVILAV